jgi:hypothetical protein
VSEADEVRDVLCRYGELYRSRDPGRLDEAMDLFVPGDEPEMVGTEAVARGGPDWAVGAHEVRELTEWDWRSWWDVDLDVPGARVSVAGDVAWVTLPGALVQSERSREGTRAFVRETSLEQLRVTLDDDSLTLEQRLANVALVAGTRARELQAPVGSRRAITLTAVLVRRGGAWLFHTTHWAVAAE